MARDARSRKVVGYFVRLSVLVVCAIGAALGLLLTGMLLPESMAMITLLLALAIVAGIPLLATLPAWMGQGYDIGYAPTAGVAMVAATLIAWNSSFELLGLPQILLKPMYVLAITVLAVTLLVIARMIRGRADPEDAKESAV